MDKTNTYTYFYIESNGDMGSSGLVGNEKGLFDPTEITELLGIEPFKCWKAGDLRRDGISRYGFSSWGAEKCSNSELNVNEQISETIIGLKDKIDVLKQIKAMYDVNFGIMIVPNIFDGEQPCLSFGKEIIEFCYLSATDIQIDMYIFPFPES